MFDRHHIETPYKQGQIQYAANLAATGLKIGSVARIMGIGYATAHSYLKLAGLYRKYGGKRDNQGDAT